MGWIWGEVYERDWWREVGCRLKLAVTEVGLGAKIAQDLFGFGHLTQLSPPPPVVGIRATARPSHITRVLVDKTQENQTDALWIVSWIMNPTNRCLFEYHNRVSWWVWARKTRTSVTRLSPNVVF